MAKQHEGLSARQATVATWPHWAQRLEENGKHYWTDERRRSTRQVGYIVAIIVNAVILTIAHNLTSWGLPFVTSAFPETLWAINLSLSATIIANACFLVYDAPWFRDLAQIVLNIFAVVVALVTYRVFPFDFGDARANDLARLGVLGLAGLLALIVVVQTIAWISKLIAQLAREVSES